MPDIDETSRLSASEVQTMLSTGSEIQLIDVRTPLEFDSEHIAQSTNIPLDEISSRGSEIPKDRMIVLVCRTGNRATRAAQLLSSYGFKPAVLSGGIVDWKKAKLPLSEGKKRLSLERQVQLTIGVILLSSVAAGWTVNSSWFIVPAFIGAGLTFAGLTGNCGLALLLAKAPWNRIEPKSKQPAIDKPSCCS